MLKPHLHVLLMFLYSIFLSKISSTLKSKWIELNKTTPHWHNEDLYNQNARWRVSFSVKLPGGWLKKVSEASGRWAASRLQHQGRSERVLPAKCSSALTDRWASPLGRNAQNTQDKTPPARGTHTHFHIPATRWGREAAGIRPSSSFR